MRKALAVALVGLACGCGGPAEQAGGPGRSKGPSEREVGEKWLFGDVLTHLNARLKDGEKLKKVPSRTRPNVMYFVADTPENDGIEYTLDELHKLGQPLWDVGFSVQNHHTTRDAQASVVFLKDQRNVVNVFSWGKYVFRGEKHALDKVRPLLP